MAISATTRVRAQQLFIEGASIDDLTEKTHVARSTLLRWSKKHRWMEQREAREKLQSATLSLQLAMIEAARDTKDPQQVFAASHAAKLAVGDVADTAHLVEPRFAAMRLIDVLVQHPEIGPVVRKNKGEVIRLFAREVELMSGPAVAAATS